MGFEGAAASHLGGSLLLLGLGTLLLGPGCLAQGFWYHSERDFSDPYEVLIPRQLGPRRGDPEVAGRISYLLQVEGKKQIVHLRLKKFLVSKRLRVSSFTKQGALVEDEPYIPSDCSYGGYLEGSPDSQATLNTCFGGLRGLLSFKGRLYQIEPLKFSSRFEHILYRLKEEESNLSCQVRAPLLSQGQDLEISAKFSWSYLHLSFVESLLVISKGRYELLNSNESTCLQEAFTLVSWADTIFQALNCRVILIALEIWSDEDKIDLSVPKESTLFTNLIRYKVSSLDKKYHQDWAHLITQRSLNTFATLGAICGRESISLSSLPNEDLTGSLQFLHALAHILGIPNDEERQTCVCPGPGNCIMAPESGTGGFSNCSYAAYFQKLASYSRCLTNIQPGLKERIPQCGNKVVEENEQCDCGSPKDCEKDKCCQPTCQLKPEASCASGRCCYNCRFKAAGKLCRSKIGECDLEEFCNGSANHCPNDVFVQDGTSCSENGYCFYGKCHSRDKQCKDIFGRSASGAPRVCYEVVNARGDRFGNCGRVKGAFLKCIGYNAVCGRLQCVDVKMMPTMPEHYTLITTFIATNNITCWGLDYHIEMEAYKYFDLGDIIDGTPCGESAFCYNRSCVSRAILRFNCTKDTCNNRGICNNKNHCHCDYGWAPPFCEKDGFGGSIDSGPPPKLEKSMKPQGISLTVFIARSCALAVTLGLSLASRVAYWLGHCFGLEL